MKGEVEEVTEFAKRNKLSSKRYSAYVVSLISKKKKKHN